MKRENAFIHTIKSIWLCMKYPFLYPRNRWDGRHHVRVLSRFTNKLYKKSVLEVSVTGKLEKEDGMFVKTVPINNSIKVTLDKENKQLIIKNNDEEKTHSISSLLWSDNRFEILGLSLYADAPLVRVHVAVNDKNDTTNYGFRYETIKLITNKHIYFWYKVFSWLDNEVLDRLLFIPMYTEWDAMDFMPGWKKAFGNQYLKELKAQLKKDKCLYSWRITDIKEKYGTLRLYCNFGSSDLYRIIDKYMDLSYETCIECGEPATAITAGYILPYCSKHLKEGSTILALKVGGKWIDADTIAAGGNRC